MQLRRQGRDAVFTVVTAQPMWQALIEACCRQNHLTAALKVGCYSLIVCPTHHLLKVTVRRSRQILLGLAPSLRTIIHVQIASMKSISAQVFDDWKAFTQRRAASRRKATHARLSNVTLAFLEACCRSSSAYAWRVFDVCAEMRHQSELRREVGLQVSPVLGPPAHVLRARTLRVLAGVLMAAMCCL